MICKYCGVDQPSERFQKAATIKGIQYFRKKCTDCKMKDQTKRMDDTRLWFKEYKATLKCEHCGNTDSRVFDFHHVDPLEKDELISEMMGFSREHIIEELAKCICLCSNCHRILHFEETNGV